MDVPCRFPGLAGFGKPPAVEDVFVQPGEKVWIGRPVLALSVADARFHVLSNVQGVIREVRLRKGDTLTAGRVILWVDADRDAAAGSGLGSAQVIELSGSGPSAQSPLVAEQSPTAPDNPPAAPAPQDLAALNGWVEHLTSLLEQLRAVHDKLGLAAGCDALQQEVERLRADRFNVAVVGEFKRGKSSLINALLGREVLPSDSLPCSAALVRVTYGDHPRASIRHRNGGEEDASIESIREIGTKLTPQAAARARDVAEIIVSYPLDLCRARVDIFDTPGLNDEAGMTEVTLSILPQADAALLVMMPESPFSMTEKRFVSERLLRADIGRVLFVVNAIDRVGEERDRERLLENIRARVRRELAPRLNGAAAAIEVRGVSAKTGLGLPELRGALENLLAADRGRILIHRAIERIAHSSQDALAAISLRLSTNAMTRQQRLTAVGSLRVVLSDVRARSHDVRSYADQVQTGLDEYVSQLAYWFHRQLMEQSCAMIERFEIDSGALTKEAVSEVCAVLNAQLAAGVSSVAMQAIEELAAYIHRHYDRVVERMNSFLKEAASKVRGAPANHDRIARFSTDTWKQALERGAGFAGVFHTLEDCVVNPTWGLALTSLVGGQAGQFFALVRARMIADFKKKYQAQFAESVQRNASAAMLMGELRRSARLPFLQLAEVFNREFDLLVKDIEQTLRALERDRQIEELQWSRQSGDLNACRDEIAGVLARLAGG